MAQTPYNPFTGQGVAPINEQQYAGIGNINQYAEAAQPLLGEAAGLVQGAATPLTAAQIQQYYSPYQQQVVGATEQQFNNQNAIQQQQVLGNAAAQGALGGDRTAVAQSVLAGQQQTAEAPVIAGLENQGYAQALSTAGQQFQQNPEAAAYGLGNTAQAIQGAGLAGANAQVGAGTLEQQTGQAQDIFNYQQYLAQQGYPFQLNQYAAGIDTGVGSQMGGTSETTAPPPSLLAQLGGLGIAGVGLAGATGGFGSSGWLTNLFHKDGGAVVPQYAIGGGTPYSGGSGFVPGVNITFGRGAPPPPGVAAQPGAQQMMQNAAAMAGLVKSGSNNSQATPAQSGATAAGQAGTISAPPPDVTDIGGISANSIFYRGGLVLPRRNRIELKRGGAPIRAGLGLSSFMPRRGFAEGGAPDDFDTRFPEAGSNPVPGAMYGSDPSLAIAAMQAYGLGSPYAGNAAPPADVPLPPSRPAGLAVADDSLPPEITGPAGGQGSAMAYSGDQGTAGLQAPPAPTSGGYQPITANPVPVTKADPWMALTAAGLGMMASRSPFPGVAIGEGGLQGLATYGEMRKQQLAEEKEAQDVDLKVKQLNQQAKFEQDRIAREMLPYSQMTAAQKAAQAETERYHTGELAKPLVMTPGQELVKIGRAHV